MRKLKLSGVKSETDPGFIINFGQEYLLSFDDWTSGNIRCWLYYEQNVHPALDHSARPFLQFSPRALLSPLSSGWAGSWCNPQLSITYTALTGCSLQEGLTPGYLAVPCLCCSRQSCKGKEEMGNLVHGRRINWHNQVGRTCFIIKAKDAFTVLQCNNSTSPCIQETPPQMRKETL